MIIALTTIGYLIASQQFSSKIRQDNQSFLWYTRTETALIAAEKADYSQIFNISRFGEGEYQGTLTDPNFIDSGVINYYNNTFDNPNQRLESQGFYYVA